MLRRILLYREGLRASDRLIMNYTWFSFLTNNLMSLFWWYWCYSSQPVFEPNSASWVDHQVLLTIVVWKLFSAREEGKLAEAAQANCHWQSLKVVKWEIEAVSNAHVAEAGSESRFDAQVSCKQERLLQFLLDGLFSGRVKGYKPAAGRWKLCKWALCLVVCHLSGVLFHPLHLWMKKFSLLLIWQSITVRWRKRREVLCECSTH